MAEADVFPKHPVSLDDKYLAEHGHAYMTGTQALVLLTLLQQRRDHAQGFILLALSPAIEAPPWVG